MAGKANRKLVRKPIPQPVMGEHFWGTLEDQRRREILAVLFTSAALITFLSLVSYPVTNTESWRSIWVERNSNLVGSPGNLLAWCLFFLTGLCAYLVPILLLICAWNVLFRHEQDEGWRYASFFPLLRVSGGLILLGCCCALVSLSLGHNHKASWIAGGLLGAWISHLMLVFGRLGAYVILLSSALITLLLTTNFLFRDFLASVAARLRVGTYWWNHRARTVRTYDIPPVSKPSRKKTSRKEPLSLGLDEEFTEIPALGLNGELVEETYEDELPVIELPEEEVDELVEEMDEEPAFEPKIFTPEDYTIKEIKKQKTATKRAEAVVYDGEEALPYQLPPLDLLDLPKDGYSGPTRDEIHANREILEETLKEFRIIAKVVEVHCGPVITRYDLRPAPGVKVSTISGLENDLALALSAVSVRIIAPVPGKNVVGIEIPNRDRRDVLLREVIASERYRSLNSRLTFAIGKTISGEPFVADLVKMPHLLIAGATGSGKSVGVNSLIASILFNSTPQEVRFLMVDPKRVELSLYQDIPHLLAPVITDPKQAASALKWAVGEMEARYRYLQKAGVRDIREYNQRMKKWSCRSLEESTFAEMTMPSFLPYIVIIIDELADLMMVAKADVETNIARLAQMARAVGIHLVLATQRPSVNILTGVIKANFPARIAFKVAQIQDSRVIIDQKGAESLLGMGDMLFDGGAAQGPIRLQGCYVSTEEIERLVEMIKEQQQPSYLQLNFDEDEEDEEGGEMEGRSTDPLYEEAVEIVRSCGQASTSLLQRRMNIGYGRAARILDVMHANGLIGPPRGSKPRELLV